MSELNNNPQEKENDYEEGLHWYVVHTYSGYENKVKANIEKTIENRKLQDQILEVIVPLQEVVEITGGVRKNISQKLFPGYVLIHMYMNDDTWYVVRNTRGVTGFVGSGSKPIPLTEEEMDNLGITESIKDIIIDVEVGDSIEVISGPYVGMVSNVKEIHENKQTVTIVAEMFGRATDVEIGFLDIKKQ